LKLKFYLIGQFWDKSLDGILLKKIMFKATGTKNKVLLKEMFFVLRQEQNKNWGKTNIIKNCLLVFDPPDISQNRHFIGCQLCEVYFFWVNFVACCTFSASRTF
jgi:hypothetical protein